MARVMRIDSVILRIILALSGAVLIWTGIINLAEEFAFGVVLLVIGGAAVASAAVGRREPYGPWLALFALLAVPALVIWAIATTATSAQ